MASCKYADGRQASSLVRAEQLHSCMLNFGLSIRHFTSTLLPPDIIHLPLGCTLPTLLAMDWLLTSYLRLKETVSGWKWYSRGYQKCFMFTAFNCIVCILTILSVVRLYLVETIRARSNYEQENPLARFFQDYYQKTTTENYFKKINWISCNKIKIFVYL